MPYDDDRPPTSCAVCGDTLDESALCTRCIEEACASAAGGAKKLLREVAEGLAEVKRLMDRACYVPPEQRGEFDHMAREKVHALRVKIKEGLGDQ